MRLLYCIFSRLQACRKEIGVGLRINGLLSVIKDPVEKAFDSIVVRGHSCLLLHCQHYILLYAVVAPYLKSESDNIYKLIKTYKKQS